LADRAKRETALPSVLEKENVMHHSRVLKSNNFVLKILAPAVISIFLLSFSGFAQEEAKKKEQEKEKPVRITEEILVVGKAPKEQPVATVTRIDFTKLDQNKPLDLSEAIRYAPGVSVTYGNKYEFTLKLRGMDSRRIALLIDGVPSYEPYYGSFDLKTVSAAGLDSLQITKGPSSVLYGPNTLAGIVNVITRRPGADPYLTLSASSVLLPSLFDGARKTRSFGLDSGFQLNKFALAGNLAYQDSNGFAYPDAATGDKISWMNTDYKRFNLNAKAYYTPSSNTEIMINGGIYTSEYGMPPALGVQKARYWHFKNWDRYTLNAGGFTSLGENATLRFRTFFVNYQNTLDQYKDMAMTSRQFESTFNNSVYGVFALADFGWTAWNSLKVSLNYQKDVARTQDDVNLPWTRYDQGTFSAAVEDHVSLTDQWKVIGGLSLDVIDKFTGGSASRLNPLLGLKFTPAENLDLHLSFSQKSRFPNMRAMYSPSGGNPDLLSETGTNGEFGFTWDKGLFLSGSVFTYQFKNMIDTMTLPDGTKRNWNIGKAHINGLELQAQKSLGWLEATLNYTYIDHKNETNDRPLDALSNHNLNFDVSLKPFSALRVSFLGLFASNSSWVDSSTNALLSIPSYFNLDAVASYTFDRLEVFLKVTNIFDDYFYSEPIFPWRARFFEVGAKVKVF
jgi:outer membrane receptor protein involved in Fe transport